MIGLQFSPSVTAQLLRTRKGVRRLFATGRQLWWCRLSDRGLEFTRYGHRYTLAVSWTDVLALAERREGERSHQERLRAAALRRIGQ